jgi:hypothetical protein
VLTSFDALLNSSASIFLGINVNPARTGWPWRRKNLAWIDFGSYSFTALLSLIGKALDSNTAYFFLFFCLLFLPTLFHFPLLI